MGAAVEEQPRAQYKTSHHAHTNSPAYIQWVTVGHRNRRVTWNKQESIH